MGKVISREFKNVILSDDINSPDNSANEMLSRAGGFHICKEISVGGTGSQVVNALQLTGSIIVTNQWAVITEVTTLTNLTAMYASVYDGTNSVDLTKNTGAVLSGATVGTFFTKDKISSEPYSINVADQARMLETLSNSKSGRPFTLTQKNGTNTYIRFHYTTTDNPVNFKIKIHFEFIPVNGSTLVFL